MPHAQRGARSTHNHILVEPVSASERIIHVVIQTVVGLKYSTAFLMIKRYLNASVEFERFTAKQKKKQIATFHGKVLNDNKVTGRRVSVAVVQSHSAV
jgi:hypothetical protein